MVLMNMKLGRLAGDRPRVTEPAGVKMTSRLGWWDRSEGAQHSRGGGRHVATQESRLL